MRHSNQTGPRGKAVAFAIASRLLKGRAAAVAVIGCALVLAALSLVAALRHLDINTDNGDMISADAPFLRRFEDFRRAFPQFGNSIVVIVDGPESAPVEESAVALAGELDRPGAPFLSVYLPEADPFLAANGLLYLDRDELALLADRLAAAQPLLAKLGQDPSLRGLFEVLGDAADEAAKRDSDLALGPILERLAAIVELAQGGRPGRLDWTALIRNDTAATANRTRRFIELRPRLDYASLSPAAAAIDAVHAAERTLGVAESGVRVRLTGSAVLEHDELGSAMSGALRSAGVSLALVATLLVIGLGAWQMAVAVFVTLLVGLAWTAGFATLAVGQLNLISVAFVTLFVGLAEDFGIHMALLYRETLAVNGSRGDALAAAIAHGGGAVALTAIAAAAGFLSFAPTDYRGLAELGVIAGGSMVIALFATLTVLPALLRLMPTPRPVAARLAGARRWPRRPHALLTLAAILGLGAAATLPAARFDVNPLNLQDPALESVAAFRELARDPDVSPYGISVLAPDLPAAEALAARLAALDLVARATTLGDLVPKDQPEKLDIVGQMALFMTPILLPQPAVAAPDAAGHRAAMARLKAALDRLARARPDLPYAASVGTLARGLDRAASADAAALVELERRLIGGFPAALDRLRSALGARQIGLADLPSALRARLVASDGRARVEVVPAIDLTEDDAMRRFVEQVQGAAPQATGLPVVIVAAGHAVVRAFVEAAAIAGLAIAALLFVTLRSWREAMLVLIPVALAGVMTGAATVVIGQPFNFANVIALPLLLGLGVAGGIHLVMRARDPSVAGGVLLTTTPRAIVFSALTTIAAFGSLAISDHRGTAGMGELLTIALLFVLFATLVALPALMAIGAPPAAGRD